MNKINLQMEKIAKDNRMGIMTHAVVGYPNFESSREIVKMMSLEGVDFIELQIPFSDPIGDGPIIRAANTAALSAGFKVSDAFRLAKILILEDKIQTPLLFMTYFNIVYNFGVEEFCRQAKEAGVSGLIIPDYTDEAEAHDKLRYFAQENNLILVDFLALDSRSSEVQKVATRAQGFVYCFSLRGVTGMQDNLEDGLLSHLDRLQARVPCPLAVGFGITSREQVDRLFGRAEIAIAGSAILRAFNQGGIDEARKKVKELVGAKNSFIHTDN